MRLRTNQPKAFLAILFSLLGVTPWGVTAAAAQAPGAAARPAIEVRSDSGAEEALAATRQELVRLLRLSPKAAAVIVRDPSLLADQTYVSRSNPELDKFLQNHPEV